MANRFFSIESMQNAVKTMQMDGRIVTDMEEAQSNATNCLRYAKEAVRVALDSFNIAGLCEVTPTFEIRPHNGGESYGVYFRGYSLHIISTDAYYSLLRGDKYSLKSWEEIDMPKLDYFRTELKEPNLVGKATPRKISDWVEYCNAITTEKKNDINANLLRIDKQMERAANLTGANVAGAQIERNPTSGQITRVVIPFGGTDIIVTRGERTASYKYSINWDRMKELTDKFMAE